MSDYAIARAALLHTQREYDSVVERVIDGDTIDVTVDLGFSTFVKQRIRVFGVNCPEMSTSAGRMVKTKVELWLGVALGARPAMLILTYGMLDKYGRRLADFYNPARDIPKLSEYLLANAFAVEYLP